MLLAERREGWVAVRLARKATEQPEPSGWMGVEGREDAVVPTEMRQQTIDSVGCVPVDRNWSKAELTQVG